MTVVAPENLRSIRQLVGMSQTELAARAQTHQVHVSRIETGKVEPSWDMMRRLSQALGFKPQIFTIRDIATGETREVETFESYEITTKTGQICKVHVTEDGCILVATGKFEKRRRHVLGQI